MSIHDIGPIRELLFRLNVRQIFQKNRTVEVGNEKKNEYLSDLQLAIERKFHESVVTIQLRGDEKIPNEIKNVNAHE